MPDSGKDMFDILATTLFGLEEILAGELEEAGASSIEKFNRAVSFSGDKRLLYRLNLTLRTASRLLVPVKKRQVLSDKDLYSAAMDVEWWKYFDVDSTFAVDSVVNSKHFNHSKYAALKVKDAIADRFREKYGKRPSVDRENPDVRIHVHIDRERCAISLDSSGEPLHRRGYRLEGGGAPLNEVLAAGMIMLSGWKGGESFIDPMCGSGTLPVEAAFIASGTAPGLLRKRFGFFGWNDFDEATFGSITDELKGKIREPSAAICGSDVSKRAVETAQNNVRRARLGKAVKLQAGPFERVSPPPGPGVLVMNPPYGQRMGSGDIVEFYRMIGDTLKRKYEGYQAWILGSNFDAMKYVGLRPSKKITLFNGPLECRFQKYEVYGGSRKAKYGGDASEKP